MPLMLRHGDGDGDGGRHGHAAHALTQGGQDLIRGVTRAVDPVIQDHGPVMVVVGGLGRVLHDQRPVQAPVELDADVGVVPVRAGLGDREPVGELPARRDRLLGHARARRPCRCGWPRRASARSFRPEAGSPAAPGSPGPCVPGSPDRESGRRSSTSATIRPPRSTCPASGATPASTVPPVAWRAASAAATCGLPGPIRAWRAGEAACRAVHPLAVPTAPRAATASPDRSTVRRSGWVTGEITSLREGPGNGGGELKTRRWMLVLTDTGTP